VQPGQQPAKSTMLQADGQRLEVLLGKALR
jgi:hypothetical protein